MSNHINKHNIWYFQNAKESCVDILKFYHKMNDKKINLIHVKILGQIQQGNEDERNATFDAVFISDKSSFSF